MICCSTREKIEEKMLQLRLRQIEIKRERDEKCKELSKVTGATVICLPIKNYFKYPKVLSTLTFALRAEPNR